MRRLRYGYADTTQQGAGDKNMNTDTKAHYIVECLSDEHTGWIRKLQLERDGKIYHANLYWDMFDGFDLLWVGDVPDWADELDWHELDERTATL